jgi:hypothetical protein
MSKYNTTVLALVQISAVFFEDSVKISQRTLKTRHYTSLVYRLLLLCRGSTDLVDPDGLDESIWINFLTGQHFKGSAYMRATRQHTRKWVDFGGKWGLRPVPHRTLILASVDELRNTASTGLYSLIRTWTADGITTLLILPFVPARW